MDLTKGDNISLQEPVSNSKVERIEDGGLKKRVSKGVSHSEIVLPPSRMIRETSVAYLAYCN